MNSADDTYVKRRAEAPEGFFASEAAGLAWLAEAHTATSPRREGVRVVEVIEHDDVSLTLQRLVSASPSMGGRTAAEEFGRALAVTHAAGAEAFGTLPPGSGGYFFGPLDQPLRLPAVTSDRFGAFYVQGRLDPVMTGLSLPSDDADLLARVRQSLLDGAVDTWPDGRPVEPARVHGDLWSGNVMWTKAGAVVIDPAACGHHPFADLAMLTLFGSPHLEDILASYADEAALDPGWRESLPIHQLFGWLVHLRLFGSAYAQPVRACLREAAAALGA